MKPVSGAMVVLATIAVVAALYFGAEFLAPIAFAAVLSVTLRPVVQWLKRWGVKPGYGGAMVVLALVAGLGVGGWILAGPVKAWVAAAPAKLEAARARLERLREPVRKMTEMVSRLEREAQPMPPATQAAGAGRPGATSRPVEEVTAVASPPTEGRAMVVGTIGVARKLAWGVTEVVILLYLLLAGDEMFVRKTIKVIPRFRDKEKAVRVAWEIDGVVHGYLKMIAMINVGQGLVVGTVMWLEGVPGPVIWGLATVVMECVPYLGATVMIASLGLVAAATFNSVGRIVLVPLSYLVITTIQTGVVSPYVYGNRLKLNPVAVFLGVLFWWFVWGIPGAFLAVPIVATAKVVADRVEGWEGVGEFLGE